MKAGITNELLNETEGNGKNSSGLFPRMRFVLPSVLFLGWLIISCQGQSSKNNPSALTIQKGTQDNYKQTKRAPYELHGIIDPGMNNMVAFALQTPTSWKMQQSFTRIWNGSTPINQVYIRVMSPDQATTIDFLPYTPYYYSDGPTTRSLRETARSYGMQQQTNSGEMQPMPPGEYIKRVLLQQLAQRGLQIRITSEKALPGKQSGPNTQVFYGYVDGTMSNGKQVRVDCMITLMTTNMNGEVYYNWQAHPSVIVSNGDLDGLYAHVINARNSFKSNPAWEARNSQLVRNGNIANADINKRNADMTRDYYNHVQKTGDEIADARNKSSDRRNESFRDVIGGEAKYESAETGERVKLADQYNHVYKDKQGNYYGSNSPQDNVQFDWEELQRVETKNY